MSEKTKYPGENGLVTIFQLIEDKVKYLKNSIIELIDSANSIFYVSIKIGATGFELDRVTYADIIEAYDSGKRIVAKAVVPAEANLGFDGNFEIPMTYVDDDGMFAFSFTTGLMNCEVFLSPSGSISYSIREYQEKGADGASSDAGGILYIDVQLDSMEGVRELTLDEFKVIYNAFKANREVAVRGHIDHQQCMVYKMSYAAIEEEYLSICFYTIDIDGYQRPLYAAKLEAQWSDGENFADFEGAVGCFKSS